MATFVKSYVRGLTKANKPKQFAVASPKVVKPKLDKAFAFQPFKPKTPRLK